MKAWLFTVFGLIIFIILSIINQSFLEKNTHELAIRLHQVEKAIRYKHWNEAEHGLATVQKKWRGIKPVWSLLLNHREIDAIDQALIRTIRAVQSRDDPTARVEHGSLTYFIKHIPKRERFSLVNIL